MSSICRRFVMACAAIMLLLVLCLRLQTPWAATTRAGELELTLGTPATGTLAHGDSLTYHLALTADGPLAVHYTTGVVGTLALQVRAGAVDGPVVGSISNDMAEKILYLPALTAGDYFLTIAHDNPVLGTLNFTLQADSALAVTPLSDPITLPAGGHTNVYRVPVDTAGPLYILLRKPDAIATTVQVYGDSISGAPLTGGQDTYSQTLWLNAVTPGTYYVLVHTVDLAAGTRPASLTISGSLPTLTLGAPVDGQFAQQGDFGLYRVDATAGTSLYVSLNKPLAWPAYVEVRQGGLDGPIVAQVGRNGDTATASPDQWFEIPGTVTGPYFIRIEPYNRWTAITTPQNYTLTAAQQLPALSSTAITADLPGAHSIRWYSLPATAGSPLFAFADHNTNKSLRMTLVKGSLAGPTVTSANGVGDQLLYVAQAENTKYFLKVSDSTVTSCQLTGGMHLPTVTNDTPASDTLAGSNDIHWYEVPVAANEELVLQLEKKTGFTTNTPIRYSSPLNVPAPTGTTIGDTAEILTPTAATTYFVRVSGAAGDYTLRAMRTFPILPLGQTSDGTMAHAGSERWYEVTIPDSKPLFISNEKVAGNDTPIEVYRDSLRRRVAAFGGLYSDFTYLPGRSQSTRYIIHKKAPLTDFAVDSAETIYAGNALPELAVGQTKSGSLGSTYQKKFYQLTMPPGQPIVLQCTVPLQVEQGGTSKVINLGTKAALAGIGWPAIVVVASSTPADFTLTAGNDVQHAGKLIFSNNLAEATVDLVRTTVGHIRYFAGSNVYLGDDDPTQALLSVEGDVFANGWQLTGISTDDYGVQATWRQPTAGVTKTLQMRATLQRAEFTCQVDTPRPVILRNALKVPTVQDGKDTFAFPAATIMSSDYTPVTGATALYPAQAGQLTAPAERWLAFWNSGYNEVYGLTLGTNYQAGLTTDGPCTVARVLCPAGRTAFTVAIVTPKPSTPYLALQNFTAQPSLEFTHAADASLVPLGAPITDTITVLNIGTGAASGVTVNCVLPANATYVDRSANGGGVYYPSTRTIIWNPGALAINDGQALSYRFTIPDTTPLNTTLDFDASLSSTEQTYPTHAHSQVTTSPPNVSGVTPANPGNTGPVTLTITGSCFAPTAVVRLQQGAQAVTATVVEVNSERTQLRVLADVTGLTGAWNITVTNPGGAAAGLPNALTIAAGGQSGFWSEISAPNTLTLNKWQTISMQYGNAGTIDDVGRLLCLYIPVASYATGTVRDEQGRILASGDVVNSLAGPLLFWLPRVGPGEQHTLNIDIKPLALTQNARTTYANIALLTAPLTRAQLDSLAQQATVTTLQVKTQDRTAMNTLVAGAAQTGLAGWAGFNMQPLWAVSGEIVRQVHANTALASYLTLPDAQTVNALLESMITTLNAGGSYVPLALRRYYTPMVALTAPVQSKIGPLGTSGIGFLMPGHPLSYQILYKNPSDSTSAVKSITISDMLDPSLDTSTLQLGLVRIGAKTLAMPASATAVHAYLDLRPQVNAIAEITIALDRATGTLQWQVSGFDPVSTALTGFLPPNTDQNAPLGELQVQFSVMAKSGLVSGTSIKNKAGITLEGWNTSFTNEVLNTIDNAPPTSAVYTLPAMQENTTFTVKWHGSDDQNGSGLVNYSIFISDNDGPYTLWQNKVTTTQADFTGVLGHTYKFYSIAEDAVGHIEAAHATPDATIKLARSLALSKGLHMVSLPIISPTADPKTVLQFDANKWARYLPGMGYVTYGNDASHLTWLEPAASVPGRAYWGYWAQDTQLSPEGTYLPADNPVSIELQSGWNMIGNPWSKALPWDLNAIKVMTDSQTRTLAEAASMGFLNEYAWGWSPNASAPETGQYWMVGATDIYAAHHQLDTWQGYWIKATRPCTLILPAPTATGQAPARANTRRLLADGWQMQLVARSVHGEDGFNWLGMGTRAEVERTRKIVSPPQPALAPGIELTFTGTDDGRAIDLRELGTAAPVWRFTVASPTPGEEVALSWPDLTALPQDIGLTLVDERTNERRYLRTVTDYHFTMPDDGQPAAFHIEMTRRGTLQVLTLAARALSGRGRGGIQIQYSLSQDATVVAELRSPIGKLIRRLSGVRAPALTVNTLTWDGHNEQGTAVPSGMYLIVLTATGADNRIVRATAPCAVGQ